MKKKRSTLSEAAAAMGRKGCAVRWAKPGAKDRALPQQIAAGQKLAEERGPEYYREIGRKGAQRRWAKRKSS